KVYNSLKEDRVNILKEQRDKSGVYCLINKANGHAYSHSIKIAIINIRIILLVSGFRNMCAFIFSSTFIVKNSYSDSVTLLSLNGKGINNFLSVINRNLSFT